jgi:1,2-diacylglycerol 3-alpha-glucosyltransferase
MRRLKIGLFNDTFYPNVDGVVNVVDNYARELSKIADVVVVVPSYGKKNHDETRPYKVIRVKSVSIQMVGYRVATPKLDWKTKSALLNEGFDIIHIHSPFSIGKLGLWLGDITNTPVVATMHSQFKRDFLRYVKFDRVASYITKKLMNVYNSCDECWAVSKKIGELFVSYGYKYTPFVMENVTMMQRLDNVEAAKEEINQKYHLNSNEKVLLFVGRINLLKNILFTVDVLKELNNMNFPYKMIFVGDGPDMKILKNQIKDYDLENNVILTGQINSKELLKKFYARSDLFVFPSLYDASSIVQIEAASQSTPTIFIENAITASEIRDNYNGFIGPNNAHLFAIKVINILNNTKVLDRVSNNTYKTLYKNYGMLIPKVYNRYIFIIKKVQRNGKKQKD